MGLSLLTTRFLGSTKSSGVLGASPLRYRRALRRRYSGIAALQGVPDQVSLSCGRRPWRSRRGLVRSDVTFVHAPCSRIDSVDPGAFVAAFSK